MTAKRIHYVALLRAINVGKRQVHKDVLISVFEEVGLADVRTLIASGNVAFTSTKLDAEALEGEIEAALLAKVGFSVDVMVRTIDRVQEVLKLDPFPKLDDATEAYVCFLKRAPKEMPDLPFHHDEEKYSILLLDGADLFMTATMLPIGRRGNLDKYLIKTFGKITTTRNWRTVAKLAEM